MRNSGKVIQRRRRIAAVSVCFLAWRGYQKIGLSLLALGLVVSGVVGVARSFSSEIEGGRRLGIPRLRDVSLWKWRWILRRPAGGDPSIVNPSAERKAWGARSVGLGTHYRQFDDGGTLVSEGPASLPLSANKPWSVVWVLSAAPVVK